MTDETNAGDLNARTDGDAPRTEKPAVHVLGEGETHVPEDDAVVLADGGPSGRFPELSDFQRDIMLTLALAQPTNGRGLKTDVGTLRSEEVNDGRHYANLNKLVDLGLVEKYENRHDERSHEFELSERGEERVRDHADRVRRSVEALEESAVREVA